MLRWRGLLFAWALVSLGAAVLLAVAIVQVWPAASWSTTASTLVLWIGMLLAVLWAFARSQPTGLLRFRPLDVLYGLALGVFLRVLQGWIAILGGGGAGFPRFATFDGALPGYWWLTDGLSAGMIAPVIEEFFFRAVVLVAVYAALQRAFGALTAGFVAVLVSTALFILFHAIGGSLTIETALSLGAVGLTCALLVMLTGRIWGAVLVHIIYNSTFLLLGLIGTLAS